MPDWGTGAGGSSTPLVVMPAPSVLPDVVAARDAYLIRTGSIAPADDGE